MKNIKKFESFFGGTHLGSKQVNTDSSVVRKVTVEGDNFIGKENIETTQLIKEIYELVDKNRYSEFNLKKIKNYLENL